MNKKDKIFSDSLRNNLIEHKKMLGDETRNKLLFEILEKNISGSTSFLDIGTGTGIWAILAAKLGARRVVAVEVEECLIPVIYQNAKENGVADKIEIIHGHSDDVNIIGKFDLIVSELFGNNIFDEKTINSFIKVRQNFLAPEGMLIPQKLEEYAAPVQLKRSIEDIPTGLPVKFSFLRSLMLNYIQYLSLKERTELELLGEPKKLLEIDFRTVTTAPPLKDISRSWQLNDLHKANAFAVYNSSVFTDEVKMNSFDSPSWQVRIHEFLPFTDKTGELNFSINLNPNKLNWQVKLISDPGVPVQNYSPGFSFVRTKMAQKINPAS